MRCDARTVAVRPPQVGISLNSVSAKSSGRRDASFRKRINCVRGREWQ